MSYTTSYSNFEFGRNNSGTLVKKIAKALQAGGSATANQAIGTLYMMCKSQISLKLQSSRCLA